MEKYLEGQAESRTVTLAHEPIHAGVATLSKCQVDTPPNVVRFVWEQINARRACIDTVADFGCGDGRFAKYGKYKKYVGFEIDAERAAGAVLENSQSIQIDCAFEQCGTAQYDVCVGNPPYIKHHDLSIEWLERIEARLRSVIDYDSDRRSNAYIYFFWLSLASTKSDGLVALVIPFEWISRPASKKLRSFLKNNGWSVDVYFLEGTIFDRVLTTACVAIVDKTSVSAEWKTYTVTVGGEILPTEHPTMTKNPVLEYERSDGEYKAIRGLSPGGQEIFVLTENERKQFDLAIGRDVVPAVTTFRYIGEIGSSLTPKIFKANFVDKGKRCWLIRTNAEPSEALSLYLNQVPVDKRQNSTCTNRKIWWKYPMPEVAKILYASGFSGTTPKMLINKVSAIHVGGIHGIHCPNQKVAGVLIEYLNNYDFASRVVAQAKGFKKLEVNQMNSVLNQIFVNNG